jgi:hypothetical protein
MGQSGSVEKLSREWAMKGCWFAVNGRSVAGYIFNSAKKDRKTG